jgi:hypothetical protein
MRVKIRMTRALYHSVLADLSRPHPFAKERVGFLFARLGTAANDLHLVFPVDYAPVPDEQYIKVANLGIGAEISSASIRAAMQRTMDTSEGVLHVHMHEHCGRPRLSRIDSRELPLLATSFQHACPEAAHGGLLLSKDEAMALIWLPGQTDPIPAECISIVGYPLGFYGRQ